MAISFGAVAATATNNTDTTPLSVPYPSGITSGQLLLLETASKGDSSGTPAHASTPSGWTFLAQRFAGIGSEGASDSGSLALDIFYKIADGSETGNLSVTITGATSSQGSISRYERSAGSGWLIAAATGAWTTDNTNPISITYGSDPGIAADDHVVIALALNTNSPTGITSESLTVPGATAGARTQQVFVATGTGRDQSMYLGTGSITAGSSTGAATWGGTKSATSQGEGPSILIRLREDAGGGDTFTASGALVGGGAVVTGSASRSRIHSATGSLQAAGAAISGSATRSRVHSASGALQAAGAVIEGAASKAGNFSASGALVGGGAAVAGVAARSRVRTASGDLVGGGAAVSGTATRTEPGSLSASGVLIGGGAAMSGAAVLRRLHSASGALSGAGATIAGVAARSGVFAPTVTLRLFATPAGSSVVASATGIEWAWYDDATTLLEALADTPTVTGSGASSDASGYLSLTLTGSTKTTGERGFLLFSDCTGAVDENPRTFGAMVEVD